MKNFILSTVVLCTASLTFGQKKEGKNNVEFNRWSVELNVGQNKPEKPFAAGYYSSDPTKYFNFNGVEHFDLGARYMFNPYFGAKLDFAYDVMNNQEGTTSLPFETKQYRVGLQGVVNVSRLLKFESFTQRFGLLVHGGLQVSQLTPQMGVNEGATEDNGGLILGVTPQIKLAKWVAITGDFSLISNVRQHFNWDGSYSDQANNLTGTLFNTSLGLTFYLGKKANHADWHVVGNQVALEQKPYDDQPVLNRLQLIEEKQVDKDNDGVFDYRDTEKNSKPSALVDSQGRTIAAVVPVSTTVNKNDPQYTKIVELAYNVMYYNMNEYIPNSKSTENLQFLTDFLLANSTVTVNLIGYTDATGSKELNQKLSAKRVSKLKEILVSRGINASRVSVEGKGIDGVLATNNDAQALARRVDIIIN